MNISDLGMWAHGFMQAFSTYNFMFVLFGTVLGLLVGVLPGVGPNFAIAMLLPLTFHLPPTTAIIFLCAVYAATSYGDSISSILINVPGGGGSVPACWDGYPMARQGRGGLALGLSAIGSWFGGVCSWAFMVLFSPVLVAFAMMIGPPEIFMVGLLALSMLAVAVKGNTIKGIIMACVGILLSCIGQDAIVGSYRYTFGIEYLQDGIDLIPLVVGVFALSEILAMVSEGGAAGEVVKVIDRPLDAVRTALKHWSTLLRGMLMGVWMGVLPALGINAASISAYLWEKQSAKDKEDQEQFGKGNPKGVLAPETSKGACVVGDLLPTFTLGVPGSSSAALLMAALIVQGVRPGVEFFRGDTPYIVYAGILVSQFAFAIVGVFTGKYWAKIIDIPVALLAPAIGVLVMVGAFADANRVEVLGLVVVFGFVGYLMKKFDYPAAPMVLGLVLGPLLETNFRRSMMLYKGSLGWCVTRPIALVLLVISVLSLAWPWIMQALNWLRSRGKGAMVA